MSTIDKKKITIKLLLSSAILVAFILLFNFIDSSNKKNLKADEIYQKVKNSYSKLKSLSMHVSPYKEQSGIVTPSYPYSITLERPSRIRINMEADVSAFSQPDDFDKPGSEKLEYYNDGTDAFIYNFDKKQRVGLSCEPEGLIVASIMVGSSAVIVDLPSIFFNYLRGIDNLSDLKTLGHDKLGKEECIIIGGINKQTNSFFKIWICISDFLILKYETRSDISPIKYLYSLKYIELNKPYSDDLFISPKANIVNLKENEQTSNLSPSEARALNRRKALELIKKTNPDYKLPEKISEYQKKLSKQKAKTSKELKEEAN